VPFLHCALTAALLRVQGDLAATITAALASHAQAGGAQAGGPMDMRALLSVRLRCAAARRKLPADASPPQLPYLLAMAQQQQQRASVPTQA
jgi:hypothetical protein